MKMFNREDAFSLEIRDQNNTNGVDPIHKLIVVDDELYVIKEKSIFRTLTAEVIDPENQHSDTRHSCEKVFDIGSKSPYVARLIMQFSEIIKFLPFDQNDIRKLLSYIWNANVYLLNSLSKDMAIVREATSLLAVCDKIIEQNKAKSTIPAFPQISDLESNIRAYLNNAKLFLVECFKLLNKFYEMPFNSKNSAHFDIHLEWAKKNIGKDHRITQMITSDLFWIRLISECRNALEHPEEGQKIKIRNLTLMQGNKVSGPTWSYDLTKKLDIKYDFVDLINDLSVFSNNMLYFFEEFLLICIEEKLTSSKMLTLAKLSEKSIDIRCPVKYIVTIKESYIKENITKR